MKDSVETVRAFWNANPCQSNLSTNTDRHRYFEEISQKRYQGRDWHIPTTAKFGEFRGKKVLEIGCSIATDGLEFAKAGADYTGIDLTPKAIDIARERFDLFGVPGRFEVVNAEAKLPFPDASFDHVYSFGVIHHSPRPELIASVRRRSPPCPLHRRDELPGADRGRRNRNRRRLFPRARPRGADRAARRDGEVDAGTVLMRLTAMRGRC